MYVYEEFCTYILSFFFYRGKVVTVISHSHFTLNHHHLSVLDFSYTVFVFVLGDCSHVRLFETLWTVARLLCPWDSPGKSTGVDLPLTHFNISCFSIMSNILSSSSCLPWHMFWCVSHNLYILQECSLLMSCKCALLNITQ